MPEGRRRVGEEWRDGISGAGLALNKTIDTRQKQLSRAFQAVDQKEKRKSPSSLDWILDSLSNDPKLGH